MKLEQNLESNYEYHLSTLEAEEVCTARRVRLI